MNIREKRAFVANAYPGEKWKARVSGMDDDQIIAVYLAILQREQKPTEVKTTQPEAQLRLFYYKEK